MSERSTHWDHVLFGVITLVAGYAVVLVVAGLTVGDHLFDRLGFGPSDGGIYEANGRSYLRLIYAVLGSVIAGWMAALAALVRGPLRRREHWAWNAVVASVTTWFVSDTGISLVLGFAGHAAFNIAFALALAVPLIAIRRELVNSHRTTSGPSPDARM